MVLPATAPTTISTKATDMATRIEMMEDASANPSHKADASQTLSIRVPPLGRACGAHSGGGGGKQKSPPRGGHKNTPYRAQSRGRGHQPSRAVSGNPIPIARSKLGCTPRCVKSDGNREGTSGNRSHPEYLHRR